MRNDEAKLSRNSFIIKLSPVFHDGLLRVGGRLDNAEVSYDVKHPIILPGKHRLTELLIRGIHEENGHVGVSQVISILRQRYWITQVTTAVRRVLQHCFPCRRRHQKPCSQKMAALQRHPASLNTTAHHQKYAASPRCNLQSWHSDPNDLRSH